MKDIQECAKFYKTLMRKDYIFTLENGIVFKLFFKASNFYHLIGLHKLKDIRQLSGDSVAPDRIYKDILSGSISVKTIENSSYYTKIADRIEHFEKIADMLDKDKCKIIIDFDASVVQGGTDLLKTKYILYRLVNLSYANLTIGEDEKGPYPETFFFEVSKKYISEQNLLDVENIEVIEKGKKRAHPQ